MPRNLFELKSGGMRPPVPHRSTPVYKTLYRDASTHALSSFSVVGGGDIMMMQLPLLPARNSIPSSVNGVNTNTHINGF